MPAQNLYQVLEIPEYSDIAVVKKSFRQLALLYHPDRNPDPEVVETFKLLVKTYEILSNPELKQAYDFRLKTGLREDPNNQPKTTSAREEKMRWYARMRKEKDAIEEVENITNYENSIKVFPLIWRLILSGLFMFTGILTILNDWYKAGSQIALGALIFTLALVLIWNELYKYYWHKSLTETEPDETAYDKKSYSLILKIFFWGLLATAALVKAKKFWQLAYFGEVIEAHIEPQINRIYYSYNDKLFEADAYFIPEENLSKTVILIKISEKEPEIWDYVND